MLYSICVVIIKPIVIITKSYLIMHLVQWLNKLGVGKVGKYGHPGYGYATSRRIHAPKECRLFGQWDPSFTIIQRTKAPLRIDSVLQAYGVTDAPVDMFRIFMKPLFPEFIFGITYKIYNCLCIKWPIPVLVLVCMRRA